MPSNTYSKDHTKLFTGTSETSKAWFIIHFLSVLIHFRIRTKHKIEPHGNKKIISWYMFSIRFTRKIKHSYKTTKKSLYDVCVFKCRLQLMEGKSVSLCDFWKTSTNWRSLWLVSCRCYHPHTFQKIYHPTIESKKAKPIEVVYWICLCEQEPSREGGTESRSKWTWRHFWWKDQRRRGICGPKQIPVPRTPSKGAITVHYLSVLVEKSVIKPNSNTLPYFYRIIGVNTVSVENVSSTETFANRRTYAWDQSDW